MLSMMLRAIDLPANQFLNWQTCLFSATLFQWKWYQDKNFVLSVVVITFGEDTVEFWLYIQPWEEVHE